MTAQKNTAKGATGKWDLLRVVLALGRGGTLSAAARRLGVDHTTVARHLESLELELAAPLFERSPLGFTPTPLGDEVLATAERMEGEVIGLLRRSEGTVSKLTGLVRLTSTPFLSARLFAPALGGFLRTMWGREAEGDLDLTYNPLSNISRVQRVRTATAPGPHFGQGTETCFHPSLKLRVTGGWLARAGRAPFVA